MSRLLINLFFIIIICITLAAMPINTEILDMFDFGELFSKEKPEDETPEIDDEVDTFEPEFTYTLKDTHENRIYNPSALTLSLSTNLTTELEENYKFEEFELVLLKNDQIYQIFNYEKFVKQQSKSYNGNFLVIDYDLDISSNGLDLDQEGFYSVVVRDKNNENTLTTFEIAYLEDFNLIAPSATNVNYAYLAYFYNEDKTHIIPVSLNMNRPNSITVAIRNSLYQIPTEISGLAQQQVIPEKTSITRFADGYYGINLYSKYFDTMITNELEAKLMVEALTKTLLNLAHIDKLSLYVDDRQNEGSLFDVDLSIIYEADNTAKIYLPELSDNKTTYLVPLSLNTEDTNETIFEMIKIFKSGFMNDQYFKQLLPPEVVLNNLLIDVNNVTLDFNDQFLTAFPESDTYKSLMVNCLLYSITSIEGIDTLSITIDGTPITTFAGFDFSAPVTPLEFINYIGQF